MRTSGTALGAFLISCVAAYAEAPLAPHPNAVDHVVTMVTKQYGRGTGATVVTHHAGWTRVDRTENGSRTVEHFDYAGSTAISFARERSGVYVYLSIVRGPERHSWLDYESFKTGERQAFLGENCEVWNVLRSRDIQRGDLTKISCVTDDGIELWNRYTGGQDVVSSAEATGIARRPVQPDEVLPPGDLLLLQSWGGPTTSDDPPKAAIDYETVMQTAPTEPEVTRITRRHAPWTYTDSVVDGGDRTLQIENVQIGLHVRVVSSATGELKQLLITKSSPPAAGDTGPLRLKPVAYGRKETVLGEQCQWFDMTPGMMDAGLRQCRTRDDVVLKEMRWSRGGGKVFEAVLLRRRVIGLAQVLPPAEMLDRKNWGLPE
jgi:hypothetical protein